MRSDIFEFQSTVCRTFGNQRRLQILDLLKTGELSVGDITTALGVSKANASQHLAVMRMTGLLKARRVGAHIYYRIANAKLAAACSLMQDALLQVMESERETANDELISETEELVSV